MGELQTDFILVFAKQNEDKFCNKISSYLSNLKAMGFVLDTVTSESLKNRKFVKVQMPLETAINAAGIYRIGLACRNPFHEPEPETLPCFRLLDSELSTQEPSLIVSVRNRESVKGEKPQKPTTAERIMTVYEALRVAKFGDQPHEFGVEEMKKRGILAAAYPLHDGHWEWTKTGPLNDRQLLNAYWSNFWVFFKLQPIQLIHKYFGPEAGFYYTMMGLYMVLLAIAAIFGLISVLIHNLKNDTRLKQICNIDHCMCPYCKSPKICNFSLLKSSCKYSRLNYFFDNDSTMPFSIVMSFWGMIFISLWDRKESFLRVAWNIHRFLRPDFATRPGYRRESITINQRSKSPHTKRDSFWARFKSRVVNMYGNIKNGISTKPRPTKPRAVSKDSKLSSEPQRIPISGRMNEKDIPYLTRKQQLAPIIYLQIGILGVGCMEFFTLIWIILYRILLTEKLAASETRPPLEQGVNINYRGKAIIYTAIATAGLGSAVIIILDFVIDYFALCLTNLENPRTQREFDRSYTVKLVTLSFINNFTIPIYLALLRGINYTHPGDYKMWQYLSGINADFCDVSGCFADVWIFITVLTITKSLFNFFRDVLYPIVYKKLRGTIRFFAIAEHPQWELDHDLTPLPRYYFTKLHKEFIIQYGYVVCFASSFQLLPLIILILNIIELRIHAMMLVRFFQRFVPRQSCERDIWKKILYIVTLFAALINAFILGTTLNWAERQYFKKNVDQKLEGYIDASVSKFSLQDYDKFKFNEGITLVQCYYVGRRVPEGSNDKYYRKYELSDFYYETYCAKYMFTVELLISTIIFGLIFRLMTSPPHYLREKIVYQEKTHSK